MTNDPQICIIIVNYNSWQDLIECVASVLKSDFKGFHIVVCDNDSADGSLDKLKAWAKGEKQTPCANEDLIGFSQSDGRDPLDLHIIDRGETQTERPNTRLTLIDTGANLGFAGGNNVGLRYAMAVFPDCPSFYLLNADTVIAPDALTHLAARMHREDQPGLCGTKVGYYFEPDTLQVLNGHRFNHWTGASYPIFGREPLDSAFDAHHIEQTTDYVIGASLCISRAFLEQVGLLNEDYFLYFEEIDLAIRNRGQFAIGFCGDALVYHKEGGAAGSQSLTLQRSPLSQYYLSKSRVAFFRRYMPLRLPVVVLYELFHCARYVVRRKFAQAASVIKALFFIPL